MAEESPSTRIVLDRTLSLTEALPLKDALMAARGNDVILDASAVDLPGTLCCQILLAAKREWATSGAHLRFENPSEDFTSGVRTLGFDELLTE